MLKMNLSTENLLLNLIIFKIGNEKYAFNIENVFRIVGLENIKKILNTPDFFIGIIKVDNIIVPIIDLYAKYNIGKFNYTKNSCIVILQINIDNEETFFIGIITNDIIDILEINNDKILPVPVIENKINNSGLFIGAIDDNSDIILIITPEGIFSHNEINTIKNLLLKPKKL